MMSCHSASKTQRHNTDNPFGLKLSECKKVSRRTQYLTSWWSLHLRKSNTISDGTQQGNDGGICKIWHCDEAYRGIRLYNTSTNHQE
jgi:hypothetical protein